MQLGERFLSGFWSARSLEFYRQPVVYALRSARMLPDTVFIVLGVVPLVPAMARGMFSLSPVTGLEEVPQPQAAGKWAQATD